MGNGITNGFTKCDDFIFENHIFPVSLLDDDAHPFCCTKFGYVSPFGVELWVEEGTLFQDSKSSGGDFMLYV